MQTIKFWASPALLAGLWIAAASFTLSELATVVPSLTSASSDAPRPRDAKRQAARARAQSNSRAAVAP